MTPDNKTQPTNGPAPCTCVLCKELPGGRYDPHVVVPVTKPRLLACYDAEDSESVEDDESGHAKSVDVEDEPDDRTCTRAPAVIVWVAVMLLTGFAIGTLILAWRTWRGN